MKIVSLLPSATEIICALGLEDQLVGVTHECDYPAFVERLPKVTQTRIPPAATSGEIDLLVRERVETKRALYSINLPVLEELNPDLIVTQALCDVCAVGEAEVRAAACSLPGSTRVINLEPQNLADVLDSIGQVAAAAGVVERGAAIVRQLNARIGAVEAGSARTAERPRVALLEWIDPPFSCGHWNPELVRLAGGIEGLGREGERSRRVEWDEVIAWRPEVVVFACCGFSVERTAQDLALLRAVPGWLDLPGVRSERVFVTDGAHYFSPPGPRLVDSLEMLASVLLPGVHPLPEGLPHPVRATALERAGLSHTAGASS